MTLRRKLGVALLLVVAAVGLPVAMQDAPRKALAPADGLDSVLWMQTSAEYRANCMQAFALAAARLDEALLDNTWTACLQQRELFDTGKLKPEALPPAVVVDVDETVLDNGDYQGWLVHTGNSFSSASWSVWCGQRRAIAVDGALDFCKHADARGVRVFYLTNRNTSEEADTRANLEALGFPVAKDAMLCQGPADKGKDSRRLKVAQTHRILLLVGDAGSDFDDGFEAGSASARVTLARQHAARWGREWIVLPNPAYGKWESILYAGERGTDARRAKKREALRFTMLESTPAPKATERPHALLRSGPMRAWATMGQACLWLQTTRNALAEVRYWPKGERELAEIARIETFTESDCIATFNLTGLRFGTVYEYEVALDGSVAKYPAPLTFATQVHWRWRMEAPDFTFTLGSCLYVNEPGMDRPGAGYGGDFELLDALAATPADLHLWLGDNTYLREPDWTSEQGIRHRNAHTREYGRLQAVFASRANYAIWDDHDYGPNNSDRGFHLKEQALKAFTDYWPAPQYGTPEAKGAFHRFEWNDVEFFMLDDRWNRTPEKSPEEKVQLGTQQMQWLKDGLSSSLATFKVICMGGQVLNELCANECFERAPAEKAELLAYIVKAKINGVVFLSGDRHFSELLRKTPDGGYPLYDFTCSPLSSGARKWQPGKDGSDDPEQTNPLRVNSNGVECVAVAKRNFGKVQVIGRAAERKLVLSCHDKTGAELWRHEIKARDLKVK